ncbi:MAG: hypothetical protein WCI92_04305 [Bacteroidota bacterium]
MKNNYTGLVASTALLFTFISTLLSISYFQGRGDDFFGKSHFNMYKKITSSPLQGTLSALGLSI